MILKYNIVQWHLYSYRKKILMKVKEFNECTIVIIKIIIIKNDDKITYIYVYDNNN